MIVVDIEATGLNPYKHSIVSMGCVDFEDPARRFYAECRIWEGAELDEGGMAVHGMSEQQVRDPNRTSIKDMVLQFLEWVGNPVSFTIAGQNPSFDRDMLQVHAEREGVDWPFNHRTVDLHSVAYAHRMTHRKEPQVKAFGEDAFGASKIYTYLGMPTEPEPHNALTGAIMETEAFARLLYGKSVIEEFWKHPVPQYLQNKPAK